MFACLVYVPRSHTLPLNHLAHTTHSHYTACRCEVDPHFRTTAKGHTEVDLVVTAAAANTVSSSADAAPLIVWRNTLTVLIYGKKKVACMHACRLCRRWGTYDSSSGCQHAMDVHARAPWQNLTTARIVAPRILPCYHIAMSSYCWLYFYPIPTQASSSGESSASASASTPQAPAAPAPAAAVSASEAWPEVIDSWRLGSGAGRAYGSLNGDLNPIHLFPATSMLFGFKRPIAHALFITARAEASLRKAGAAHSNPVMEIVSALATHILGRDTVHAYARN